VGERPDEEEWMSILVILQDGGALGRLDDPGSWVRERISELAAASALGEALVTAASVWLVFSLVVGWLGGTEAAWRMNARLVGWAVSAALAVAWLPIAGALRLSGRAVPLVGMGLISLVPSSTPRVREPETAELQRRKSVNPRKAPRTRELSHGQIWTPVGVRSAVSGVIIAESGGAKGQTHVNYMVQYQMLYSPEHLILMEVKPNLELSHIVYANMRPGDRVYEYTTQEKDVLSSAVALISDPKTLPDVCWFLSNESNAKDSHWNEKASECMEQTALGLMAHGAQPTINDVRDVIADRERLSKLRRRFPPLEYVADEGREWGYIRSTAAKRLKPLSDPLIRRVFAGYQGVPQPDFSRREGREIVIVRPDWASADRTARLVTALIHAVMMSAVRGGYAGGPGTKGIFDEAGSFMKLDRFGSYLDLARGGKINVVYILQSRAQLVAQLGQEEASRVWSATELKIVGPTSDLQLAREIAALSGERRVHYTRPRRHDEIIGQTGEDTRHLIQPNEITNQQAGQFVMVHRGEVLKYAVPRRRYHHTRATKPPAKRPWPQGMADPESYAMPQMIRLDEALEVSGGGEEEPPEPRQNREASPEGPAPGTTSFPPVSSEVFAVRFERPRGERPKECPYCGEVNGTVAQVCGTCGTAF
jgi:hypothetical protein